MAVCKVDYNLHCLQGKPLLKVLTAAQPSCNSAAHNRLGEDSGDAPTSARRLRKEIRTGAEVGAGGYWRIHVGPGGSTRTLKLFSLAKMLGTSPPGRGARTISCAGTPKCPGFCWLFAAGTSASPKHQLLCPAASSMRTQLLPP